MLEFYKKQDNTNNLHLSALNSVRVTQIGTRTATPMKKGDNSTMIPVRAKGL